MMSQKTDTYFPPCACGDISFGVMPLLYFTMKLLLPADLMYLMLAGAVLYFILYEVTHYICHLPDGHWVLRMGFFRSMKGII